MTGSASKVDQTTLGEEYDMTAILHQIAVDLGLDVSDRFSIGFQPGNVDLDIEMANI